MILRRHLGLLAASVALAPLTAAAQSADEPEIAAISGYFAQGFGLAIVEGLEQAEADFGIDVTLVDTGNRALDYEEQFINVAQDGEYELVFVMGWELVNALEQAHQAYPDQHFVFIDGVLESPEMTYVDFAENEGSFLAGALAALMTTHDEVEGINADRVVGFVGGRDIPVIRNFLVGYEQGVAHIDPDIRVASVFAGTFDDPARGSELAMSLYGQGVDIVYNAAGPTGEGVLQASGIAGRYSIGVDIDQCDVSPGGVMASMLKRVDTAVYDLAQAVSAGEGVRRGAYDFNVAAAGVELLLCPEVSDSIPEEVRARLEQIRQDIASGAIVVDSVL